MNQAKLKRLWSLIPDVPQCRGCGECCGPAPHLHAERRIIEQYCAESNITLPDKHNEQFLCPALDDINRCRIYPARPTVCRLMGTLNGFEFNNSRVGLMCDYLHASLPEMPSAATGELRALMVEYFRAINNQRRPYLLGYTQEEFDNARRVAEKYGAEDLRLGKR